MQDFGVTKSDVWWCKFQGSNWESLKESPTENRMDFVNFLLQTENPCFFFKKTKTFKNCSINPDHWSVHPMTCEASHRLYEHAQESPTGTMWSLTRSQQKCPGINALHEPIDHALTKDLKALIRKHFMWRLKYPNVTTDQINPSTTTWALFWQHVTKYIRVKYKYTQVRRNIHQVLGII